MTRGSFKLWSSLISYLLNEWPSKCFFNLAEVLYDLGSWVFVLAWKSLRSVSVRVLESWKLANVPRDRFQLLKGTGLSLQEFIKGSQASCLPAYKIELLITSHPQRWGEDEKEPFKFCRRKVLFHWKLLLSVVKIKLFPDLWNVCFTEVD